MDTKTVSSRMHSLIVLYDMHTDFFPKVIEGISEKDANNRLGTKANHAAWITGSLVQERFEMGKEFGSELKQSAHELFKDHKGIQEGVTYPSLDEFKKDWDKITPVLRNSLVNISDEKLDSEFSMPEMKMPYFKLISFIIYREANCIGQIALWRRLLGYDAMKYM
ncbi:MAG: DinB family protein [Ignavibacteria bacterium]